MKFSIYGWNYPILIGKELEKRGHIIYYNEFKPDIDVVITQGIKYFYPAYRKLKVIRKNKIKFVNYILDIPPWRFEDNFYQNSFKNYLRTRAFDINNRYEPLYNCVEKLKPNPNRTNFTNILLAQFQKSVNLDFRNKQTYYGNFRNFLKKVDLNLSISKFTQHLVKRLLRINSDLCYLCVDSDLLSSLPSSPIKYDAINISRLVKNKNQYVFVEAANRLGLKILVIGRHEDKNIKLNCKHYYEPDFKALLLRLSETKFYVDPSKYEGFGMTPVEAAFLGKITIASNTFIHREILGDYPLYYKTNDVDDLVKKMKTVLNGDFVLNQEAIKKIKDKYSIQTVTSNLLAHIESLF